VKNYSNGKKYLLVSFFRKGLEILDAMITELTGLVRYVLTMIEYTSISNDLLYILPVKQKLKMSSSLKGGIKIVKKFSQKQKFILILMHDTDFHPDIFLSK
jgi:hypothetical protein